MFLYKLKGSLISGLKENPVTDAVLFPNPTSGILTLEANDAHVTGVTDLLGRPMDVLISGKRTDLSSLPDGVFFLTIVIEGHERRMKVVKQ